MKKLKHLLPLLLVAVLLMSLLPLGAFAQEGASTDPAEATSTPALPGDIVSSGSDPETTTPPAETAAPTATPAPTPTAEPTPVPTAAPTETPAPTEAPEIAPPGIEGPSIDEPYGDGIVMGPNNPPEDGPVVFSTISGTASIAVHNCYDSSGSQIKYYTSFYWNGKYIGGNGTPRYQITANGSPAYCIEPGGYLPGGSTVLTSTAHVWNGFSSDKRDAIKVALLCSEPGNSSNLSGNFGSQYTATQLIVWEIIIGARSTYSPYNCTDSKVINSVCSGGANSEVKTVYDQISNAMRSYSVLPSFVSSLYAPAPTSEMTYQNGNFTITLTDSNGVLSNYNFTSTNGSLRFSTSGNRLTITSSSPVNSATVNVTKKNAVSVSSTITAYAGNGLQETIVGVEAADNTSGYFMVNAEGEAPPPAAKASIEIIKTSDDGYISGIMFAVSGEGRNLTGPTDSTGHVRALDLEPGTYTVTETVPSGYVADKNPQTVTVSSGEAATVYFHNSLKKGTIQIVKTSDDGVVRGIKFTVSGPSGTQTVTTGSGGTISVPNLTPGTYTVTETVPAGYTADKASQTVTVKAGQAAEVDFHNSPAKGNLKIVKTSDDGVVNGIKFNIVGTAYNHTFSTDAKGVLNVVGLTPGTYTVTEQVPSGYTADKASQTVTVEAGKKAEVYFHNSLQKGGLKITKTSSDGIVAGITFTVTGNGVNKTVTTGSGGTISIPDLAPGSYTVTETVPSGYTADKASQTVTVKNGEVAEVTFHNTLQKGSLKVVKTSDDGVVSGIKFRITGTGYDKTYPTDSKGVLNVVGITPGTYTVTEQVPDGYKSDNPSQTISIKAGTLTTINFHNTRSLGSIRIVKTSDDGHISGIQFTVKGGSVNQTVTSGTDGTITVPGLTPGQYTVTEQVPAAYACDNPSQTVTVEYDKTATVTFRNTLKTGNVKIVKTSDDGHISGIQFTVKGGSVNQTVTSGSDGTITVPDLTPGQYTVTEQVPAAYACDNPSQTVTVEYGKTATVTFRNTLKTGSLKIVKTSDDGHISGIQFTVKGGSVDQSVTSGTDGTITVPGLVPGQYTVTEDVPEGYVCDNPSQNVTVEYDKTAEVHFENELKMWRVAVTKVDADANVKRSSRATLEGAQYGVYHDGALQDTYTTDSGGHFTTNYYACGTGWTLQEINAPTGYTVDPNSYSIGLEPGTTQLAVNDTELTVPEEIIEGKLLLTKQDGLTQTPLAGAVFTVMDETGATVTEATTGEDGTATVESLPFGTYTAKETKAPEGYQLDETVFDFAIETDGQTVTLTRENVYNVGSITVHKADTQGNTLAGATYLLEWSQDGSAWNPVTFRSDATPAIGGCTTLDLNAGQLTTGADGTVKFDGLVANGKVQYRLTETKAPEGLSLLKDPVFQGTLPFDAATGPLYDIAYTVTNNRITNLPQTGSSGLLLPVTVGTALLGLAGCAGFFVVRNRKKSKSN